MRTHRRSVERETPSQPRPDEDIGVCAATVTVNPAPVAVADISSMLWVRR